jgi:hypothetical protein
MKEEINRVSADLLLWRNREERFEKLFPGTLQTNLPFLKEKLDFLDNIRAGYGKTANDIERMTLHILNQDRQRLVRIVYPTFLERLIRFITLPFKMQKQEQISREQKSTNLQSLRESVIKLGFGQTGDLLQQQVNRGSNSFSIPVSYYLNEHERMNFDLSFTKDHSGQYLLESYKATLAATQDSVVERQQNFQCISGNTPTAEQAYNLLAGRSIQMNALDAQGNRQISWRQLDFNDKDSSGNFRIKEFPQGYGFDLIQSIQPLLPYSKLSPNGIETLTVSLAAGNKPEIVLHKDNLILKVFIEANPHFKRLNIYNEKGEKVSLSSLSDSESSSKKIQSKTISLSKPAVKRNNKKGLSA